MAIMPVTPPPGCSQCARAFRDVDTTHSVGVIQADHDSGIPVAATMTHAQGRPSGM